jgi:hypothetical protein
MVNGTLRRKAARRTEPWYLASPPLPPQLRTPERGSGEARSTGHSVLQLPFNLALPPPPLPPPAQDEEEDIPPTKKPRLDPIMESTVAVTNDVVVIDLCNDGDDEKLKSSITCRKAPRAKPSITRRKAPRAGSWTEAEDRILTNAVQMHSNRNGKDWYAIIQLVPGRTKTQCTSRWNDYLKYTMDVAGDYKRTGQWTAWEDLKLMDSIRMQGVKDWVLIATLVPGRTKKQCWDRWKNYMNRNNGAKS